MANGTDGIIFIKFSAVDGRADPELFSCVDKAGTGRLSVGFVELCWRKLTSVGESPRSESGGLTSVEEVRGSRTLPSPSKGIVGVVGGVGGGSIKVRDISEGVGGGGGGGIRSINPGCIETTL